MSRQAAEEAVSRASLATVVDRAVAELGARQSGRDAAYGDGYDFLAAVGEVEGVRAVAGWGADGWDLGDWPLLMVFHVRRPEGFVLVERCEGDLTATAYATEAELVAATDEWAAWFWRMHPSRGPGPEVPAERRQGPYRRRT